MRTGDRERVAAAAETDLQGLQRAVGDAPRHPQARDPGRGQIAGVAERVARVVHVQRVAAAFAVDRQHRSDGIDVAARIWGQAAHVYRVGVSARVDRRGCGDRPDVHRVGIGSAIDGQQTGGRLDRDRVAAGIALHDRCAGVRTHDGDGVDAVAGTDGK